MRYDIYFHNDFDGQASAALMLNFLRSRGDDIERYIPLDYGILPQWLDSKFFEKHKFFRGRRNPAIVVDFLYHPGAAFWFDHHPTTFKKENWRKKFKSTKFRRYNPEYKSACHFIEASLRSGFGWKPPKYFKELVKWLDIIDGAGYRSARQVIEMKEPALRIAAFIDSNLNKRSSNKSLIELLSRKSLKEIASSAVVKRAVVAVRKKLRTGLSFFRKNTEAHGRAVFIDLTPIVFIDSLKFAFYYLYPRSTYGVRLSKKNGFFHLGVGANPWLRLRKSIHLGELMRKYGGGGHKDAAAATFGSKKAAEDVARKIIKKLK